MAAPTRRSNRTDAVADVISALIDSEVPPVGDKARWLAARTSPSKDTWSRVLTYTRVLDYADLAEAADALGVSASDISRLADEKVAGSVGEERNDAPDAAPTAFDEERKDDYGLVAKQKVVEVNPDDSAV